MPKTKPLKTSYHHGDLKVALIETALKILSSDGIEALSLRSVAKAAGVSHAAPYSHFKDKEALLAATAERGFILFKETLEAGIRQATGKPIEWKQLVASGVAYVEFADTHPDYFKLMFGEQLIEMSKYPALLKASNEAYQVLNLAVEKCKKAGLLVSDSQDLMALTSWAIVHGLAFLNQSCQPYLKKTGSSRKDLVQKSLEIFGKGLLK